MEPSKLNILLFTSSIPTVKLLLDKKCIVSWKIAETLRLGTAGILGGRNTWWLGTAGILCGILQLGTAGILGGWALWGYLVGTAGILCGWALQGYSAAGHCRDTLRLGTAGILCGWALQGYSAAGHCRDTLPLSTAARLLAEGDNIDFKI